MATIGKILLRTGGGLFAFLLVVSMVLGYSGSARLSTIGNTLLLLAVLVTVPLLLAGLVLYLIGRSQRPAPAIATVTGGGGTTPPTGPSAPPAASHSVALSHKITDLDALREAGSITDEEHQALRQRAMDAFARGLDT